MEDAARVAIAAVHNQLDRLDHVRRVRFVLFDEAGRALHQQVLDGLADR
jgi:hypothetical protein